MVSIKEQQMEKTLGFLKTRAVGNIVECKQEEIAVHFNWNPGLASQLLTKMKDTGVIELVSKGKKGIPAKYRIIEKAKKAEVLPAVIEEPEIEGLGFMDKDGKQMVCSLAIAKNFDKRHDNVMRDIEVYLSNILDGEEIEIGEKVNPEDLFIPGEYTDSKGRTYPCYFMTQDGFAILAFGFTGKKAMWFKLRYIGEFNRLKNQEKVALPMSEGELLYRQSKLLYEMEQKTLSNTKEITAVKEIAQETQAEIGDIKASIADVGDRVHISGSQRGSLHKAVGSRVSKLQSASYGSRPYLFSGIWNQLKDKFNVAVYEDLPEKDFDEAMLFIKKWIPNK